MAEGIPVPLTSAYRPLFKVRGVGVRAGWNYFIEKTVASGHREVAYKQVLRVPREEVWVGR